MEAIIAALPAFATADWIEFMVPFMDPIAPAIGDE